MADKIEESLKTVINGLLNAGERELREATEADLEGWWFFKWDKSQSLEWNIYQFNDLLDLYKSQCRQWEEMHHGHVCVVERVRDKYLMPKIKNFIKDIENH